MEIFKKNFVKLGALEIEFSKYSIGNIEVGKSWVSNDGDGVVTISIIYKSEDNKRVYFSYEKEVFEDGVTTKDGFVSSGWLPSKKIILDKQVCCFYVDEDKILLESSSKIYLNVEK